MGKKSKQDMIAVCPAWETCRVYDCHHLMPGHVLGRGCEVECHMPECEKRGGKPRSVCRMVSVSTLGQKALLRHIQRQNQVIQRMYLERRSMRYAITALNGLLKES